MKQKLINLVAYLILATAIGFHLYLNYPETQILADPNDNIFQYSLVARTDWVWKNYSCPLSFSCLPNLTDHVVPAWAEGYPLPFYYSHIPQIAIVSSYNLIIHPLFSIFQLSFTLYQYYNWTKYLLFSFFPVPIFLALRLIGFSPILAAFGAFFASHFSTDGLYGIDPPSYLWRGYGLTSQLYAIFFLPLGLASIWKLLHQTTDNKEQVTNKKYFWGSIIFLTLTTAGHLGIGIIGILSTNPFLFFDLKPRNIFLRCKKLFFVLCCLLFVLSYWIIPILLANNYHIVSFWDPIWKFNSYGWYEVIRQFLAGEIFDWQRGSIITGLVIIGFFSLLTNIKYFPFAMLFSFWILLYFGRTTWGGLLDLIPGMKDFHQHRFVVGVHMAAIFLIPAGLNYILLLLRKIGDFVILAVNSKLKIQNLFENFAKQDKIFIARIWNYISAINFSKKKYASASENKTTQYQTLISCEQENFVCEQSSRPFQTIFFYILPLTFVSILSYFTIQKTIAYAQLNNRWIGEANTAYLYDEKNFRDLTAYLDTQPKTRIYAGRPGNWGHDFRLGSTQMYMLFGANGYDISQFLPETWSPLSENEQNFDEREAVDYDLLNIGFVVSPKNQGFPETAKMEKKFGPFELYRIPTSGWFDVVTSPMFVATDKTNFINLVHLWQSGYPRRWKMHPLISVEKTPEIPSGMQKVITMVDEVSYTEYLSNSAAATKNIFADFPFVFPEATVSGKIKEEKVDKQTYSATIDVPQNCKQCMIMFKMSYHPNWRVKVDGKETAKYSVFPFYLATPITEGVHTVEFFYQPNRLKVVLIIGEILIGVLFLFRKKIASLIARSKV